MHILDLSMCIVLTVTYPHRSVATTSATMISSSSSSAMEASSSQEVTRRAPPQQQGCHSMHVTPLTKMIEKNIGCHWSSLVFATDSDQWQTPIWHENQWPVGCQTKKTDEDQRQLMFFLSIILASKSAEHIYLSTDWRGKGGRTGQKGGSNQAPRRVCDKAVRGQ